AVLDEGLEDFGAALERDVGRERLAGGALAQHAVAARAALEVDLARLVELRLGHRRGLRVDVLVHLLTGPRRTACLVANLGLGDFLLVRLRPSDGRRR